MRKSTNRTGITWKVFGHLEDLDFADDVCLLSESQQNMQSKLNRMIENAKRVGLKINENKTKLLAINCGNDVNITTPNGRIEQVRAFNYLGSNLNESGGTEEDIKIRIGKAHAAFISLQNIWRSKEISEKTKIRLFNSNIISALLYGCESWRVTNTNTHKLQTFINKCLRKILKIHWPETISNEMLWTRTNSTKIDTIIKERKWKWIGHVLRKKDGNIAKEALEWNPQGQRKRGRPATTWRRSVLTEAKSLNKNWTEIKKESKNRVRWRKTVAALSSAGNSQDK